MKGHVAAVGRQESRVWKESRDLKERKEKIVNSAVSQTNWKQCVWKNLGADGDSEKIKVQEYLENAMKNNIEC